MRVRVLAAMSAFVLGLLLGAAGAPVLAAAPGPASLASDLLAQEVDVGREAGEQERVEPDSLSRVEPAEQDTAAGGAAPDSGPRPGKAEGAAERPKPAGPWHLQPRWVMLRSVLVPGWGQWTNGKRLKALVVAGSEGYLIYRAVDWGRIERNAVSLTEEEHAAMRRRDFTWWSIFAGALSMGDAYVDAHLRNFDVEFKGQDPGGSGGSGSDTGEDSGRSSSSGGRRSAELRAAVRYRFP